MDPFETPMVAAVNAETMCAELRNTIEARDKELGDTKAELAQALSQVAELRARLYSIGLLLRP